MRKKNYTKWLVLINAPTIFLVLNLIYSWFHFQSVDPAKINPRDFQTQFILEAIFCLVYFPMSIFVYRSLKKDFDSHSQELENEKMEIISRLGEITKYSEQLTQSSSNAASSMEQTVSSLEELNSMVQLNSEHAKQAASLSQTSRDTAVHGEQEINLLIQSMKEISESSKRVQEITYLIDDISFQTNLLALNAAVEAARAGEQGRGFAVVADAVRTLAQKSAVAAKDIANLINETSNKVEKGFSQANNSGEVLKKILTSVKMVSDLNNEISLASQEQTSGLNQISAAMNIIDKSLQENTSTMQDLTNKVSELQNSKPQSPVVVSPTAAPAPAPVPVEKASETHLEKIPKTKLIKKETPSAKVASLTRTSEVKAKDTTPKPEAKEIKKKASAKLEVVKAEPKPTKAEELIPFDEDMDRVKLSKAEDF